MIRHDWLEGILNRLRRIRVLELCAGMGIGGVALAKTLMNHGYDVDLVLIDIREDALRVGKEWGEEELGIEIRTYKMDITEEARLDIKGDIALMYGYSTSHFDPWQMLRILSFISNNLEDYGLFISQETDRIYGIFYRVGYKDFLPEKITDKKVLVSIFAGYDYRRGVFKRAYMDLKNPEEHVILNTYLWNIADLAALTWIFFSDVDYMLLGSGFNGFLLAKNPRRKITFEDISSIPKILRTD